MHDSPARQESLATHAPTGSPSTPKLNRPASSAGGVWAHSHGAGTLCPLWQGMSGCADAGAVPQAALGFLELAG